MLDMFTILSNIDVFKTINLNISPFTRLTNLVAQSE